MLVLNHIVLYIQHPPQFKGLRL